MAIQHDQPERPRIAAAVADAAADDEPELPWLHDSFNLDGSRSFDVGGGRIVQFVWTYLGPTTVIG